MKSFIVATTIIGLGAAQVLQACLTNMGALYADFGCSSATDYACLCNQINYANGIRDCSSATCQDDTSALQSALAEGLANFRSAASSGLPLSATSVFASGAANDTATVTADSTSGPGLSSSGSSSGGTGGPITTVPLIGVITTDGSTITTTTGSSTIYQGGTIAVTTENGVTILGVPQFTTVTTDGSTVVSAYSTSIITGSSAASSASDSLSSTAAGEYSSAASEASSASISASAASASVISSGSGQRASVVTLAVNGIFGAAGVAAIMLL